MKNNFKNFNYISGFSKVKQFNKNFKNKKNILTKPIKYLNLWNNVVYGGVLWKK
ncbi:MAG TPA: hypothetical protein PLM75_01535 [bacterium]|nr:hypothetical protein [bacterium]